MKKRSLKVNSVAIANTSDLDRKIRFTILTLISLFALSLFATKTLGQTGSNQQPANAQQGSQKEYLRPSGDSIKSYRPAGRDPFKKILKPKVAPMGKGGVPVAPKPLGYPVLEERRAKFRAMVEDYGDRGLAEPNPVMQYLVSELEVTGIFRDEGGYGAFIRAVPTGTTFFIRRGARCYNGEVLRIESDTSNSGSKVTFRQESFVEVNGKQVKQENVLSKQPTSGAKDKLKINSIEN